MKNKIRKENAHYGLNAKIFYFSQARVDHTAVVDEVGGNIIIIGGEDQPSGEIIKSKLPSKNLVFQSSRAAMRLCF